MNQSSEREIEIFFLILFYFFFILKKKKKIYFLSLFFFFSLSLSLFVHTKKRKRRKHAKKKSERWRAKLESVMRETSSNTYIYRERANLIRGLLEGSKFFLSLICFFWLYFTSSSLFFCIHYRMKNLFFFISWKKTFSSLLSWERNWIIFCCKTLKYIYLLILKQMYYEWSNKKKKNLMRFFYI